jgi:hypothetical protein
VSHARQTIRAAIKVALESLTTTGKRVYTNHVYPFDEDTLPNLSIYTLNEPETVEDDGEMGSFELRVLPFQVAGRAKASSDLDDTLDDIAEEVETALHASTGLATYSKLVRLQSTEIELDGEGEIPVGVIRMNWIVIYRVDRTAPTAPVQ